MGRMNVFHSVRRGEFCCDELTSTAEYLGIKSSFTAAYSPNQNGMNERNHAIVDNMISKMRTADPGLSVEVALTWALVAKNTLQNVSGFSPFQIVFGHSPSLPSVYTVGPPGLEEVAMSKSVADHINALFLAREAFIQGESDRVLKAALKQRVYKRGEDIEIGDWIYFNNTGKWQGPVKVTAKDGKSLYVVRGGKLLTINTDHAQLAGFEGEMIDQPKLKENDNDNTGRERKTKEEETKCKEIKSQPVTISETRSVGKYVEETVKEDQQGKVEGERLNKENKGNKRNPVSSGATIGEDQENQVEPVVSNDEQRNETHTITKANQTLEMSETGRPVIPKVKKDDTIRFKKDESSEWIEAKVVSRAGKVGSKYDKWWNLKNIKTGHVEPEDLDSLKAIEKVGLPCGSEENEKVDDSVYVVNIPRYRHNEEACKQAKDKELAAWDRYEVYEEVEDVGQVRLGTNWVLTEKEVDGVRVVKARLTVRGDQEDASGIRKDSPTVRKGNIKIFATVAAKERWEIKTCDVTSAFLQGVEIDRDVFVRPPAEKRIPGVLWKLLKAVYGLVDAPRGWHLALDDEFMKTGCGKCSLDPAMYLYFTDDGGERVVQGIAVTHVDDILHGGSQKFDEEVVRKVKSAFNFGSEGSERFRYVGMNMTQTGHSIIIDQDHYVQGLELPDMSIAEGLKFDNLLCSEGQTMFRGCVAKILHVGYQSRPDVCFQAKCLSSKFGKATKSDLKTAYKKMQKLQGEPTKMCFPDLGTVQEWTIVGYGDAGIRSMPDKLSSVGGQVIMIANAEKGKACVLNWRSKKLVRKVVSSLAGEALALVATVGEIVYNKAILKQIYGEVIEEVPVVVYTDCRNLHEAVFSTSLVEDAWLIPDIAILKESIEKGTINYFRRVESEDMLANCLTKAGASAEKLMTVLQTGQYEIPPGVDES